MKLTLKQLFFFVVALSCIVLVDIVFTGSFGKSRYGTVDFKEYWSAFQLLCSGLNPYDPFIVQEFQKTHFGNEIPLMMWNPPWLFVFMIPALVLDYGISVFIWMIMQVLFFMMSLFIVFSIYQDHFNSEKFSMYVLLPSLLFSPVLNSLYFGQIGCLLLFGASLVFYGLERKHTLSFVSGALIFSVKPHLFFILGVVVLWHLIRVKDIQKITLSLLGMFSVIGLCHFLHPELLLWWGQSFLGRNNEIVPGVYQWVSANFGGALREYVHPDFVYLNFLLPLFLSIGFLFYVINKRFEVDWKVLFPPLVLVSVYFAPFGWFFDQSLLLFAYVAILINAYQLNSRMIFIAPVFLQILSYLYMYLYLEYLAEMFWYAPLLFGLWLLSYYMLRFNKSNQHAH